MSGSKSLNQYIQKRENEQIWILTMNIMELFGSGGKLT